MKKILALVLALSLLTLCLVACGSKKEYTLTVVVDNSESENKVSNTVCALITDSNGKIVACAFDAIEVEFKLDADGKLVVPTDLATKGEQGENYGGTTVPEYMQMASGSWYKQAKAYADGVVGKTAEEVAAIDGGLVAGCTRPYTSPLFQQLIAKAFASEYSVTFKADKAPTLGLGVDAVKVEGAFDDENNSATVTVDCGAVAVVDGAIVAAMLDTAERTGNFEINEDDELDFVSAYNGSKNEQGEKYGGTEATKGKMPAGAWYKQAAGFCSQTVGLTKDTIKDLAVTGDAMTAAGCTMGYTVEGYKTVLTEALSRA